MLSSRLLLLFIVVVVVVVVVVVDRGDSTSTATTFVSSIIAVIESKKRLSVLKNIFIVRIVPRILNFILFEFVLFLIVFIDSKWYDSTVEGWRIPSK